MPSNIEYDQELLQEAQRLGNFHYKKDAVNAALKEFVQRRRQLEIIDFFHKVEIDPGYNHKTARKRKCKS